MNARNLQILLVGCLLVSLAAWMLTSAKRADNDERKFHRMVRESAWGYRLYSAENWLPRVLARVCRIASLREAWLADSRANEQALYASGYLATEWFTVTNFPASASSDQLRVAEAGRRLGPSALSRFELWALGAQSNQVMIVCPRKNAALIRTVIERP
jgi:hypothetical protein